MPGLGAYYEAFWLLSTCRSVGMGVGPIPLTAIWTYADREGFSREEAEDLVAYIADMDSAYVGHKMEELKKNDGSNAA